MSKPEIFFSEAINFSKDDIDLSTEKNSSVQMNFKKINENQQKLDYEKNPKKNLSTNKFNYYLLVFFSCVYFTYGFTESFLGPAFSDLTKLLNTDSEHLSYAWSFRNFVYCFSTIIISFSFKYFGRRELQYTIAIFVLGLSWGFIPFMVSLTQYMIGYFFSGIACAYVDSVTNLNILEIFSSNSKTYIQLAHLAYATGSIFGPLLIGPFLSKDTSFSDSSYKFDIVEKTSINFKNLSNPIIEKLNTQEEFNTEIKIPYLIGALLFILISAFFFLSQSIKPHIPKERKLLAKKKVLVETTNNLIPSISGNVELTDNYNSCQNIVQNKKEIIFKQIILPQAYYLTFLGITGFLISIFGCIDSTNSVFLPVYLSNGELKLNKVDAAYMHSLLNTSMTIGRFITTILTIKLSCKTLLFINSSFILTGYFILSYLAIYSQFLIWLSMVAIGFGLSSAYPLMFSFVEDRIITTNSVQLYLLFSSSIMQLFVPIIIGNFIDDKPFIFVAINLFLAVVGFIFMSLTHQIDIWKNNLIRDEEDKSNEN